MAYRIFTIPIRCAEAAEAELNGFLRGHRVLSVERRWVDQGESSFWAFCVDYLESSGAPAPSASRDRDGQHRNKVDYRERLSPEDFAVFARLRDLRKEMAQAEAVPVYTVFTNEQLAQMVQARVTTKPGRVRCADHPQYGESYNLNRPRRRDACRTIDGPLCRVEPSFSRW